MYDFLGFSKKCDFCMYSDGCLGPIPGDVGKCMGFVVSLDDASRYAEYLAAEASEKKRKQELFRSSLDCTKED